MYGEDSEAYPSPLPPPNPSDPSREINCISYRTSRQTTDTGSTSTCQSGKCKVSIDAGVPTDFYQFLCEQIGLSIGWTHLLHAAKRRTAMDNWIPVNSMHCMQTIHAVDTQTKLFFLSELIFYTLAIDKSVHQHYCLLDQKHRYIHVPINRLG